MDPCGICLSDEFASDEFQWEEGNPKNTSDGLGSRIVLAALNTGEAIWRGGLGGTQVRSRLTRHHATDLGDHLWCAIACSAERRCKLNKAARCWAAIEFPDSVAAGPCDI